MSEKEPSSFKLLVLYASSESCVDKSLVMMHEIEADCLIIIDF